MGLLVTPDKIFFFKAFIADLQHGSRFNGEVIRVLNFLWSKGSFKERGSKKPFTTKGTIVFLLMLSLILVGCSSVRLEKTPDIDAESWQQYGGTMERTNVSGSIVSPPLTLAWIVDASAGYSEYSVSAVDSNMFIGNLLGEVYGAYIPTGEEIGSYDFGSPIVGAPVIDSSMMYVALANTEESLYGYDLLKGNILWAAKLGAIETSPLLAGGKLFVTALDGEVYCINKTTGAVLWKFLTPLFGRSSFIHSSPASDGKVIVFGCDNGSVFCISAEDGKLQWRAETGKSVFGSPSIRDGKVFVGSQDEHVYAFDLNDGKQLWKQSIGSKIFSSQAVDSKHVYIGASSGAVICLESSSGAILWKFIAGSAISSAPLLSGEVLYAGSLDRKLYALNAQTGELLWDYTAEGRIKSTPIAWKEYLIVPLDNRMVLGLKGEPKK